MSRRAASLGRRLRTLRRPFRRTRFDVVWAPECCAAVPGRLHDARRAPRILEFLRREGLLPGRRVHLAPEPPLADLLRVHTLEYLESLERPGGTEKAFGERLDDAIERPLVVAQRRMAGGTTLAARLALDRRATAVHLGGGLHHARADHGAGFCLFHDVGIAIRRLRHDGFTGRVLVLDLDLHDGDGTRALFAADASVHTFSIHNRDWEEPAGVETTSIALGSGVDDELYLARLRAELPPLLERFAPQLVFFLAGVDVADDDALGDWRVSAAGIVERDRFVHAELARRRLPVARLLAGGYGDHAWRHTARSLSALALGGTALEPPSTADLVVEHFRHIAGTLPAPQLAGDDDALLSDEDVAELFGGLGATGAARRRFLGFYTPAGIELALERLGYLGELERLGFERPTVEFDLTGPADTLRIFGAPDRRELLLELRARRDRATIPGFELLWLEWLLLQNPRLAFTADRPALPGQQHPGLGMLRETLAALVLVCDRLKLDGIGVTASHFHPAAQSVDTLCFVDPRDAPVFRGLVRSVAALPALQGSLAVEGGGLVDAATGEAFRWRPLAMVYPISPALRAWFERDDYRRIASAAEPRFVAARPPA